MAEILNQAQLSYNTTVVSSNVTVGELLPALSLTKTAVRTTYSRQDGITYIVSLTNSSGSAYTGITVTDDLGGYAVGQTTVYPLAYVDATVRLYTNGTLGAAPTVTAGPPLAFTGITVPANGNVILVYEASVTEYAPLATDSQITNTASVTIAEPTTTVSDSETVNVRNAPSISVTKHMEPTTVINNDTVTYTFVIENYGNTALVAEDGSVLTDTFTPALSNISVTFNGEAWTAPANYTYSEATGAFATVAGGIIVPAATFTQDQVTGAVRVVPGTSTLVVTGRI